MKKIKKFGLLVICLMLLPLLSVHAEEPRDNKFVIEADDQVTSKSDVNGSGLYAGNNITFENTIDGIGFLAGNNVNFKGNAEYGVFAGNTVNVTGTVTHDAFAFGNMIDFDKNFVGSRDVIVFGNVVTIDGNIMRDVEVYASQVVIKGKITGNVKVQAGVIEVEDGATIGGTLKYLEDAETKISTSAVIGSQETMKVAKVSVTDQIMGYIVNYGGMLLVFLVAALVVPGLFKKIETQNPEKLYFKFIAMFGYGILSCFAMVISFIILMLIGFGAPLAMLLLALFFLACFTSTIFTGYFVGLMIWKGLIKKEVNIFLVGLIGITVVMLLGLVPYIGAIVTILSLFVGLGIVLNLFRKEA